MSRAADRWASAGIHRVLLPSGTWVKFRVPDATDLLRRGQVPADLRHVAQEYANKGSEGLSSLADAGSEEVIEKALLLAATLVCSGLRAIMDPDDAPAGGAEPAMDDPKWEAVAWQGAEFVEMDLPGDDRATLNAMAMRRMTPRQATWLSRQDLRLVDEYEHPQMVRETQEDAVGTPGGWGTFHGEPGSGAGGSGGQRVAGEPSSHLPGHQRPAAALPGGRGPGDPAEGGRR